jgi:hypothetical protein
LQNETLGDGGGGQVVEHLPSKHETLSSNTSTVGRKEGRKEGRKKERRERREEGREEKRREDTGRLYREPLRRIKVKKINSCRRVILYKVKFHVCFNF